MHYVWIPITSEQLTLSTSYFQRFILHHLSVPKYILGSWTCSVPVSRCPIPRGVLTRHNFRQEYSNRSKFGFLVERSCSYRCVLFVNFYVIRYGDTAVQSKYKFPARIAPLYLREPIPFTEVYEYSTHPVGWDIYNNHPTHHHWSNVITWFMRTGS